MSKYLHFLIIVITFSPSRGLYFCESYCLQYNSDKFILMLLKNNYKLNKRKTGITSSL